MFSRESEFREDGKSKYVRIGIYVHKGKIVRVMEHDQVRTRSMRVGTGEKHDPVKEIFPAVYDMPRPETSRTVAGYFRAHVTYRGGDFYIGETPLFHYSREWVPLADRPIIDPATLPPSAGK